MQTQLLGLGRRTFCNTSRAAVGSIQPQLYRKYEDTVAASLNLARDDDAFREDLNATERTKEDEEIVQELMSEQMQKNKHVHFQNEQMGTRWTGDYSRNTLQGHHVLPEIEKQRLEPSRSYLDQHSFQSLDDSMIDKPPPNYYQPHPPLPAFRNHESLFTIDPRNPNDVAASKEIESEPKSLLRANLKPEKLPHIRDGVSYSPDFDFDLWGVDFFRPRVPLNPQDWGNRWIVNRKVKPMMQRKTLSMRKPKRRDKFAPDHEKLIEFRYYTKVIRNRWKPWKKPVYQVVKILGNGRGCAGFGIGRASSYDEANRKANYEASSNMMYIPRYRNRTLAHPIEGTMNNITVRIEPRRVGAGGNGPWLLRAVCTAFGVHDYQALFIERRKTHITRLRATFRAFLNCTNATKVCEDRGQRLVKSFPEQDYMSYHLPRGFAHDNRVHAVQILRKHMDKYEAAYEDKFLPRAEELERMMPEWCKQPRHFWEACDPDVADFKLNNETYGHTLKKISLDGSGTNLPHARWLRLSQNERDRLREEAVSKKLEEQRLDSSRSWISNSRSEEELKLAGAALSNVANQRLTPLPKEQQMNLFSKQSDTPTTRA